MLTLVFIGLLLGMSNAYPSVKETSGKNIKLHYIYTTDFQQLSLLLGLLIAKGSNIQST